jgi:hypothetical protein
MAPRAPIYLPDSQSVATTGSGTTGTLIKLAALNLELVNACNAPVVEASCISPVRRDRQKILPTTQMVELTQRGAHPQFHQAV